MSVSTNSLNDISFDSFFQERIVDNSNNNSYNDEINSNFRTF